MDDKDFQPGTTRLLTGRRSDEEFKSAAPDFDIRMATEGMQGQLTKHAHVLSEHNGQLKVLPALASALHQNFAIWFAAIALVAALIMGGFAFLGSYQVSTSQAVGTQGEKLSAQGAAIERIEGQVTEISSSLQSVDAGVRELRVQTEVRAAAGQNSPN